MMLSSEMPVQKGFCVVVVYGFLFVFTLKGLRIAVVNGYNWGIFSAPVEYNCQNQDLQD